MGLGTRIMAMGGPYGGYARSRQARRNQLKPLSQMIGQYERSGTPYYGRGVDLAEDGFGMPRRTPGGGMVDTGLGVIETQNWQERFLTDLAQRQSEEISAHGGRLSGIAEDIKSDWDAQRELALEDVREGYGGVEGLFAEERGAMPGAITELSNLLSGQTAITDLPQFQGMADYIERAIGRQMSAGGYNMSGNMAQAVGESLQKFGAELYKDQAGALTAMMNSLGGYRDPYVRALLGRGDQLASTRRQFMYPSDIYADLRAQSSQAEAQRFDPLGEAVGYVSEMAIPRTRRAISRGGPVAPPMSKRHRDKRDKKDKRVYR